MAARMSSALASSGGPGVRARRPSPRSGSRRPALALAVALALIVGGCGIAAHQAPLPTTAATPVPSLSAVLGACRTKLEATLRAGQLALIDAQVPFRPAESPSVTAAPRLVTQVVLPQDPAGGFIVLYEFPDASAAYAAAREQAAYLATGPGRVQFVPDAQHILRADGSCIVFYSWSPANSPDPASAAIPTVLGTFAEGIPIRP
jgi:hypothetical protein